MKRGQMARTHRLRGGSDNTRHAAWASPTVGPLADQPGRGPGTPGVGRGYLSRLLRSGLGGGGVSRGIDRSPRWMVSVTPPGDAARAWARHVSDRNSTFPALVMRSPGVRPLVLAQ